MAGPRIETRTKASAEGDLTPSLAREQFLRIEAETARRSLQDETDRLGAIISLQREIVSAGLDLGSAMGVIAKHVAPLVGGGQAGISLVEGDYLVYRASDDAGTVGLRIPLDESIARDVIRSGEAQLIDNPRLDPRFYPSSGELVVRSLAMVPLHHHGSTVGVLIASSPQPGVFTQRDVQTLQLLAGVASEALTNAALFTAERERHAEQESARVLLQEQERYLRTILETAPVGVITADMEGKLMHSNRAIQQMLGYSYEELLGMHWTALSHPEHSEAETALDDRLITGEIDNYQVDTRYRRKNGEYLWVQLTVSEVRDGSGQAVFGIGMVQDISEQRQADTALRTRFQQHEVLAALGAHALSAADLDTVLTEALEKARETLNVTHAAILEWMPEADCLLARSAAGWSLSDGRPAMVPACADSPSGRALLTGTPVVVDDIRCGPWSPAGAADLIARGIASGVALAIPCADRPFGVLNVWNTTQRIFSDDDVHFLQSVAHLLGAAAERNRMEQAVERHALYDSLTGLPNRILLHDRLEQTVRNAQRDRHPCALLLLDLDRFKELNDAFGHPLGDALLAQISGRLSGSLREADTIARLGGDEFAVLLPEADTAQALAVAQRMLASLEEEFMVQERALHIGGSVGVVLFPEHGTDAHTLLRQAEVAMYTAKRAETGYALYATDQDAHGPERLALIGDLRRAIDGDEIILHYQPKIEIRSGRISSVEALARWPHPERGFVAPGVFIPLAEQTGLIKSLTRTVLRQAVAQARCWRAQGLDLDMSINLSARNLHDPQLLPMLASLLQGDQRTIPCITLEITESAIMEDPQAALATVTRLHDMGLRVSIDDFGTGYSSLAYLKRLPVDEVKIDRSFIMDMTTSRDSAFIVRSIIELGHNLGLRAVAEGVEDEHSLDLLRLMQCDQAQGYYFSRPIPADELVAWQRQNLAS